MPTQREAAKRATAKRVLSAAQKLLDREGFEATTVRDIAAECGVSVGTVMAVGDKRALVVQVFDGLIAQAQTLPERQEITGSQGTHASTLTLHPPEQAERLLALVEPFVTIFTSHLQLARTYASILASGKHDSWLFTDLAARLIAEFAQVLGSDLSARTAYFAYVGVVYSWASTGSHDVTELNTQLRETFASLCHARATPLSTD